MKKRTLSKLKSIFGSRKGKRHHQQESSKSSRSPSPEPQGAYTNDDAYRPVVSTPPPSRAGPPPSPPVPTHPIAPVPPDPLGPLPLMPCAVCGRTFLPQSLAKHVKICEKMTIKKRKTFDSSRQRREGTDLEQYLPKNFGIPENSPFREKSPAHIVKPVAAPKPKLISVKTAIMKPMADRQRCPHCNRSFGMRAFERHVEWCADKAKILPAAPAQPPQHIADAKQRLNARTQYKAPPVRGRRSSQSRDKSSNSRSASVESSRGVSPPPPRESGDYKQGRTRASESVSSNDCHDDASPHVPVIRNTRNFQNNSSGDVNVKARQARLARDLSSSRKNQDSHPSSVQQSNTDPNIKKIVKNPPKSKLDIKKQQHLKKLEELANKYKERQNKLINETGKSDKYNTKKQGSDKSQIPLRKRVNVKKHKREFQDTQVDIIKEEIKKIDSPKPSPNKDMSESLNAPQISYKENKFLNKDKIVKSRVIKKDSFKNLKDSSISLDSLEEPAQKPVNDKSKKSTSIGINTELLCPCVPCVIHDNLDQKIPKNKTNIEKIPINRDLDINVLEPQVEFLYKNLTMVSSCDIQVGSQISQPSLIDLSIPNLESATTIVRDSDCTVTSNEDFYNKKDVNSKTVMHTQHLENDIEKFKVNNESNQDFVGEPIYEEVHELSAENYEDDYERDMSNEFLNDSVENKDDEDKANESNIISRHGSGDTYTKFTENPNDLEEFLNLTDQMMSNIDKKHMNMSEVVENFHTPNTNSIETLNKTISDSERAEEPLKHNFSDTFEELKHNLKELLNGAGDTVHEGLKESEKLADGNDQNTLNDTKDMTSDEIRTVNDMEHITVYQLKFYESKMTEETNITKTNENDNSDLKLPSITENNKPERKTSCSKKKVQKFYKSHKKFKMLGDQDKSSRNNKTFIKDNQDDNSDVQSISAEAPPFKLPRIENTRLDDNYDPFACAARQMKELMSSETNIPKKVQNACQDPNRTLPILRPNKEKSSLSYLRTDNTKMMKDSLNKTYQKTPTLQRMKSFGSAVNENSTNNSFGGRCSSFRINRNDKKSSQNKLNTTFTKSSKENISTTEKNYFNRNNNLNRSFSSYTASAYSTPKPRDKIPKIGTSMYHSFQRTTIKQPVKLDKIKKDDRKDFVHLNSILADDNSSMTDSNYIDPRLINENDNLPINVNTILNNPDIISSMESLLTTENLPAKFDSLVTNIQNNNFDTNGVKETKKKIVSKIETNIIKIETNNNINNKTAPIVDDLSAQYDKIMSSLEQSTASKTSIRDDDSLCEDFDLEEFMTSFDEEIHKQKAENKRTCSSTTRVVKQAELIDSNRSSEVNSMCPSPKIMYGSNGLKPINKSLSLNFSSNNIVSESLFPSSVKRSSSLLDSIQKKNVQKLDKSRHKADQLEQDIMQSLKEFDQFYESENIENQSKKEPYKTPVRNGMAKRESRVKSERKNKRTESASNGNYTPNGKSNDSAYSSLNRVSPSKLSVCTKESNGLSSLDQIPAGSDSSGCQKDEIRSLSSEEFLAMERSAELDGPLPPVEVHTPYKELENPVINEKRASSRASSRRSPTWRPRQELSSSESEASLHRPRRDSATLPRLSRFCHECGSKFPETAKFCIECGVKRLMV